MSKFIDPGRAARIASATTLQGAVRSAAELVHTACLLSGDPGQRVQTHIAIGTRTATVPYCWPDAGDNLGLNEIDTWVDTTGFTASLPSASQTRFTLDGAPDPATCSVTYEDAYDRGPALGMGLTLTTSGC